MNFENFHLSHNTFLDLDPKINNYYDSTIIVSPIPYDATSSYFTGSRDAPFAIIQASRELEDYDFELDLDISKFKICTTPFLNVNLSSPKSMTDDIEKWMNSIFNDNKFPVVLGGDHSISIGTTRAAKRKYNNLSVLYFDAHADFRDTYQGTKWGHASSAKRISEFSDITILGVRSISNFEKEDIDDSSIVMITTEEFKKKSKDKIAKLLKSLNDYVYISLDLDVLDPSIMPTVGNPEPGGIYWNELLDIIKVIGKEKTIVGADIVELIPNNNHHAASYIAAKLVYKIIGYANYWKNFIR